MTLRALVEGAPNLVLQRHTLIFLPCSSGYAEVIASEMASLYLYGRRYKALCKCPRVPAADKIYE